LHALLFIDLVDSTALVERLGDARSAELFAAHDGLARALLAEHGGHEIDRADGFFMLFQGVADACRFALAYQRGTERLDLRARVGLHAGPVVLRHNAPADVARGAKPIEVEGLAKPLAARIMGLAHGGQTLLSAAARQALDEPPAAAELCSHGHFKLKGIDEPVEIHELGERGLSAFTPPADTLKAYRVARAGDFWSPARDVRHNLPIERDSFIGRSAELHQLALQIDAGARLVTLLGPGGTGKTRVARRFGWTSLGDWPGGVYFCDLSEARSVDGILIAVASAFGVAIGRDDPVLQLGHAIAGHERCLVILDNFEQVTAHAEATLGRWLDRAPDAAFIVTSRERLQLRGEQVFPVEPLPLASDALALFEARARAQDTQFVLDDAHRATVAQVVRLLDGLPLAIELAAARVRVLSPAQLLERLRDRFRVLAGARGSAARQATLRAAIDWSWQLLDPWEQSALAQCSVFEGAFTLGAAEAVLDLSAWPAAPMAIDVIQALADKSLLRSLPARHEGRFHIDEPYFGMYISIHEYAAERLQGFGDAAVQACQARHGEHFAQLGTDEAIELLSRHGSVRRRHLLALDLDNLIAACTRATTQGRNAVALACYQAAWEVLELLGPATLAVTLGRQVLNIAGLSDAQRGAVLRRVGISLRIAGRVDEGAALLEQALALARARGDRAAEADLLNQLGNLRRQQGQVAFALECNARALAMHRELGNRRLEGQVLGNLGIIHAESGRFDEARALFVQALVAHREVGNRRFEGIDLSNLANVDLDQSRPDAAAAHIEQALAIHREMGNRREEGIAFHNLGTMHQLRGDAAKARSALEESLRIAREVGFRHFESMSLGSLCAVLADEGDFADALRRAEQALAIHRALGNRREEGHVLAQCGDLLARCGRFDEAWRAFEQGVAVLGPIGDALQLALLVAQRGRAELAAARRTDAERSLAEAQAIAAPLNLPDGSQAALAIAQLRKQLGASSG
jgi:predicted ATPase/class 3 adenylate cyclase/Tfp pilus assembly protein PilF